jgi:prepilin-type N-terminal cleavage/methylation domain-containing protein
MESSSFLNTEPRGFTLMEMIVVLAIISIITAVVLSGNSQFDKSLTITDTAYTVALSVRQAQSYGLSSRTYSGSTNAAYGVHFGAVPVTTYTLFADIFPAAPGSSSAFCPGHLAAAGSPDAKAGNCLYDAASGEMAQTFTFGRGFTISSICGHSGVTLKCSPTLTGIDILFLRPNTDSIVTGYTSGGPIPLSDAQITLSAPGGASRYICVTSVGEVSVSATTCP